MTQMQARPRRRRGLWIDRATLAGAVLLLTGLLFLPQQQVKANEALIASARAERAAGDFRAALVDLKNALAEDPGNLTARLLYAQTYLDLGDGADALAQLRRAQQDGAKELEMTKLLAEAELLTRQYENVVRRTASPPVGASTDLKASLLAARAAALGALGKTEAALATVAEGLSLDPRSVEVLIAAARVSTATGDLATARQRLAAALAEAPKDPKVMRLQGDIAFAERDYAAAEEAYRSLVSVQPWNRAARTDLARTQIMTNKLQEAVTALDALLEGAPKDPDLNYLRGLAAFRQNDFATAYSYSTKALAVAKDFSPAQLIAGASGYALGHYEEAAAYYLRPYLAKEPGDVLARKLLAAVQLRLGQPASAVETLSPALDKSSGDAQLLEMIGVAAARGGDMASANRYLKEAVQQQPDNSRLREELGKTDLALGDANASIEEFEKALKANPNAVGPQTSLFLAYLRTREFDKALAAAGQVTKNQSESPAGFDMSAAVYFLKGDREATRAALLKAREILRSDPDANENLAKLALADGKVDEARQYYLDILKDNPNRSQTYRDLAALEHGAGREDEAEADLVKGLEANPDDPLAAGALALHRLARGQSREAIDTVETVMPKWPHNPVLLDILGRAQLALGQTDAAVATFHSLVGVTPHAAAAHRDLAEAYLTTGKSELAIPEAGEAVKLDPKDKSTRFTLAQALIAGGTAIEPPSLTRTRRIPPVFWTAKPRYTYLTEARRFGPSTRNVL